VSVCVCVCERVCVTLCVYDKIQLGCTGVLIGVRTT